MPYIKEEYRQEFSGYLAAIGEMLETPGELNYCFTILMKHYLFRKGKSYLNLNDCIGALEAAKLEFYRRDVAPYEDKKIKENGDIKF